MSPNGASPETPTAQAVHLELRNANNSAEFLLSTLEQLAAEHADVRLLDVGAGPGTITISLAKFIPNGQVTGVDINSTNISRAQVNADAEGVKNVTFQEGDAKKLPFDDASFDVVFCHQVLTHLSDPQDALREMLRVTKPGGVVAAREGDYESEILWPELPGLIEFRKLASSLMKYAGGTTKAGRQLIGWALEAGVERKQIEFSVGTWSYVTLEEKRTWAKGLGHILRKSPQRARALDAGFSTEDNMEAMARDWEKWAEAKDSSIAMLHGQILVQK